jgi:hypothetical protein
MISLLIKDPAATETTDDHRFGGVPSVAATAKFKWPTCKSCRGPMQFLGQLRLPERPALALLFMCGNEPGMCDEWEPDAGGNFVTIVSAQNLKPVRPPRGGVTELETKYGARVLESSEADYGAAHQSWTRDHPDRPRDVLGQLRGDPVWIQNDETPTCSKCGRPMRFLAQLEEGPDHRTAMNFGGGGCAYAFDCPCDPTVAKMLWQC